jgi:formate hydrogenlyase subunit 3/multisubunit Na+/H+ antiporter MnhD subunit
MFGTLRCVAVLFRLASLQYLHISHYLCLESLLFVFVSVASRFRRKNFFRYHTVGAVLGLFGAALVCVSVVLNVTHADQPPPCSSPSGPSRTTFTAMPLAFSMACVALSQLLFAILYVTRRSRNEYL